MLKSQKFYFYSILLLSLVGPHTVYAKPDWYEGACKKLHAQVINSCKKAGYVSGKVTKTNGLWKDCIGPILIDGQTIQGVDVDQQLLQECKSNLPMSEKRIEKSRPGTEYGDD